MANFPCILGARSLVSINFHARETDYVLLPLWSGSRLWRRSITILATTPGAGFCARENERVRGDNQRRGRKQSRNVRQYKRPGRHYKRDAELLQNVVLMENRFSK